RIIERKSGSENEHPTNGWAGKSGLQKLICLTIFTRKSTPATSESTRWNAAMLFLSTTGVSGDAKVPTEPLSVNVTLHATSTSSLRRESFFSILDASARIRLTSASLNGGTAR